MGKHNLLPQPWPLPHYTLSAWSLMALSLFTRCNTNFKVIERCLLWRPLTSLVFGNRRPIGTIFLLEDDLVNSYPNSSANESGRIIHSELCLSWLSLYLPDARTTRLSLMLNVISSHSHSYCIWLSSFTGTLFCVSTIDDVCPILLSKLLRCTLLQLLCYSCNMWCDGYIFSRITTSIWPIQWSLCYLPDARESLGCVGRYNCQHSHVYCICCHRLHRQLLSLNF